MLALKFPPINELIRWRDIFLRLERSVDATEAAAHILEGVVIKNA